MTSRVVSFRSARHTSTVNLEATFAAAVSGLSRRRSYLVGVSGGGDSVALLHLLLQSGFKHLRLCHLDHRLRGRASTADAQFVLRLAQRLGLSCEIERADVATLARAQSHSIETAARQARLDFFARLARAHRCPQIFLGHHADDQAETVLANLLRGSGLGGLAGMQPRSPQTIGRTTLQLLRPLLGSSRDELINWLSARRIRHRTDASNTDTKYQRNNLRHRVLPELERLTGRDPRPALLRLASLATAEDEFLESLTPHATAVLSLREIHRLPLALQRRLLTRWLRYHQIPDLSFQLVERIRHLLDPAAPAKLNLPGGSFARRRAGRLFLDAG